MGEQDVIITVGFSVLLMLLLVAVVIIIIFITNRRHTRQEVKIAQMQLDYEKELRKAENEVQEQVLTNVARELHDNVGQLLTFMRIQMEQEKYERPDIATILDPVDNTLSTTIDQVRALSKSLNSDHLEQTGLLKAMQAEIDRLKQVSSFTIHWQRDDIEPTLDKGQKLMVFRIFQEILNNILKHARAKNIFISMTSKRNFSLEIRDDGRGFDKEVMMQNGKGSGLNNIYKRAALADLNCQINSVVGEGSTFVLKESA